MSGPTGIGLVTFIRTYARPLPDGSGLETFEQCLNRVIGACNTQLGCGYTDAEKQEFKQLMMELRGIVAGRFLWQLGTGTVDRWGLMSLQNCAAMKIDHPVRAFTFLFECLMLGVGVGYNIEISTVRDIEPVQFVAAKHIHEVCDGSAAAWPDVNEREWYSNSIGLDVFVVPDSREGWVKLLRLLLSYHFPIDGNSAHPRLDHFIYNTIGIRPKGTPIKTFGGIASGHDTLAWGIQEINRLLNASVGRRPTPTLLLDIGNIIGHIVVSGNVRRSAEIAVGTSDDPEYLLAKRWDSGVIPYYRSNSNNSVVVKRIKALPELFWEGYEGNGEPYGMLNLDLCRSKGQVGSPHDTLREKKDPGVVCVNPCGEQPLENYETCCLAEVFLSNCESYEQAERILYYLYRTCKHSLRLPCHWPETQAVVHRNMRMGLGITGYLQASEVQQSWLPRLALWLDRLDIEYSQSRGFPRSVKLRTVKPSGTLSLLGGVTAGGHPAPFKYYLKRMRMAADHFLVQEARERGYHVEPVEYEIEDEDTGAPLIRHDDRTVVVDFTMTHGDHVRTAESMTAIDQMEVVRRLQRDWSDNSVSVTVKYELRELPQIREYLQTYWQTGFKALSFLLKTNHGFRQAPWTPLTREEYIERVSAITRPFGDEDLNLRQMTIVDDDELALEADCVGGSCPRR